MCACVAAASRQPGGALFEGVAPEARLWSMRTDFYDSELTAIFDLLARRAARPGVRLVVNCSFGPYTAQPPEVCPEHTFEDALRGAIEAGALVFFSAGDNHRLLGGDNQAVGPNTIWRYKSWRDVFVVGACTLEGQMQCYSSRGPGQWCGQPGTNAKPDLVAYAPDRLQALRGDRVVSQRLGWGTSGACPQAAGAAALLWSAHPQATGPQIFDALRQGASPMDAAPTACGAGVLEVGRALAHMASLSP
jgi:serine protease AprX